MSCFCSSVSLTWIREQSFIRIIYSYCYPSLIVISSHQSKCDYVAIKCFEGVAGEVFLSLAFTRMPGDSYRRQLGSLLLSSLFCL